MAQACRRGRNGNNARMWLSVCVGVRANFCVRKQCAKKKSETIPAGPHANERRRDICFYLLRFVDAAQRQTLAPVFLRAIRRKRTAHWMCGRHRCCGVTWSTADAADAARKTCYGFSLVIRRNDLMSVVGLCKCCASDLRRLQKWSARTNWHKHSRHVFCLI